MWIEKTGKKPRAFAYYKDPLTGIRHKVSVTMEKDTPQQRNKARKEIDAIILRKMSYAPEGTTLKTLTSLYIADQKATVKASTSERNEYACKRFLKLFGENCDVNKLTAGIVKQRFLAHTQKPTTVNEYITRFKALMRWGYANDYVERVDWLDKLTKMHDKTHREKIQDKFLEQEECKKLLDAMTEERWRDLTEFLILSGLRIGEALALNESDLQNRQIIVNKTLNTRSGMTGTTKTTSSTRSVSMQDDLYRLTRSIRSRNKFWRHTLGIVAPLLFFEPDGAYASYDAYRIYLERTSKSVLGRKVTPHTLRHTHASLMAELSIDNPKITVDLISRRLGHADSKITREIYIHVTKKRKQAEDDAIRAVNLIG